MKEWLRENHPDLIRIIRLTLYELSAWASHLAGKISLLQWAKLKRLQSRRKLKLNIASGGVKFDGWVCIDVTPSADIRMDLRRRWPLPDGSASLIFCEHFCDHLNYPNAISKFLAECQRVLEPGGRARFVMHDAEDLARAFSTRDENYFKVALASEMTMAEDVNMLFRFNDLHQFLYDFETFENLLRKANFSEIIRCRFRQSEVPGLALDYQLPSREVMSMYIEAVR